MARVNGNRFINLTGHVLHVYASGRRVASLPADGNARADVVDLGEFTTGGLTVAEQGYIPPTLPTPEPGVWLVVSQVAALTLLAAGIDRHDVLIPGPGVSDRGRTVGCRGLRRPVRPLPTGTVTPP